MALRAEDLPLGLQPVLHRVAAKVLLFGDKVCRSSDPLNVILGIACWGFVMSGRDFVFLTCALRRFFTWSGIGCAA